jgi:ribose transport system ATP-binding protein
VDVLLLDEPTRGVDVGARSEIYRIITDLAQAGMAVVMASSDMPEVLSLSHRALVMRDGAVVAELDRGDLSAPDVQERVFRLAAGLEPGSVSAADGAAATSERAAASAVPTPRTPTGEAPTREAPSPSTSTDGASDPAAPTPTASTTKEDVR